MALSDRVVVMEHGKILQVGTPEEIYQRPGSRSVAAFFGSPNLLDAEVTASQPAEAGFFRLDVAGKDWRGQCRAASHLATGTRVGVLVRPETISLSSNGAAGDGDAIRWTGKVKDMIFRGSRRSIAVETAAQTLRVEAPSQQPVAVGDTVTLTTPARFAWAIEG
jgi:iron(III) transport system ATP-binding protein